MKRVLHSPAARVALLVLVAAALILAYRTGLFDALQLSELKQHRNAIAGWIAQHPTSAGAAYFGIYVAVTALSIPGAAVMTLAGGALFGLWTGIVLVSFASSIGASLAFLVARYLLREWLRGRYPERMRSFDAGIERDGAFYLFTLRLVPLFPFFLVNLFAGLTALRLRTFYWVSQLAMLPATVAYVYAGTRLAQVETPADVLSPGLLLAFAVLGLLPLATRWLARALAARRAWRGFRRPRRYEYNLVVIGAGSAGLVSAYIAAAVNARVALVEKHRMGGDCLNTGCVPSKALIRTARLLAEARESARFGIRRMDAEVDFAEVMERVQRVIRQIEPHDSPERYRSLGVDVVHGQARLLSPWDVEVDGRRLSARSIVIATGARPRVPALPGLTDAEPLTSDTLWALRALPRRLLVLGGGPVGCELAQAFARLGAEVTIVQRAPRLLPREDPGASALLLARMQREGVHVATSHEARRFEAGEGGHVAVCDHDGTEVRFAFDRVLVALGRTPNIEGFGLEQLGITLGEHGTIGADALMRTSVPNIHVCGDVAGPWQFTHTAAHQAWYAAVNALLAPFWSFRVDTRVIPWCTFTDPEVARVGLSEAEAAQRGIAVEVTRYALDELDRAIADSNGEGFVKVLTAPGSDRILGATVVGAHAGELVQEFVLAMRHGLGLGKLLGTIHIYPTMMEANRYAAGAWKRAHAPERMLRWAQRFFAWRRG